MEEEDPFDYEEQDVSRIIRPSIHEMVDNIQWLDQVRLVFANGKFLF